MKKSMLSKIVLFLSAISLSLTGVAQEEKSEVQVKIIMNGKVLKDTIYMVEDEKSADIAVKMMDLTLGEKSGKQGKHVYTFITEDGQSYEWKSEDSGVHKLENHSYVFTEEGEEGEIIVHLNDDGQKMVRKEVIVKKIDEEGEGKKNEIIVISEDKPGKIELDGETIEWIEEGDHKILIINDGDNEKKIKVITGDKDNSSYNFITEDGKKIIIKEVKEGDNKDIEVEVIVDDQKGEIKKEEKKKKK